MLQDIHLFWFFVYLFFYCAASVGIGDSGFTILGENAVSKLRTVRFVEQQKHVQFLNLVDRTFQKLLGSVWFVFLLFP